MPLNFLSALQDAFSEIDKNSDGFISKEELKSAMLNCGQIISNQEVDEMIKLVDVDGMCYCH